MRVRIFIGCALLSAFQLASCYDSEIEQLNHKIEQQQKRIEARPASLAILTTLPICLAQGTQAGIEFRINPSEAALWLDYELCTWQLDRVGTATRQSVASSQNVSLVRIEQVYDPETQALKPGQYRAIIKDANYESDYDELLSLVLTCYKGTSEECQISSSAFEVKSVVQTSVHTGLPVMIVNTPDAQPIQSKKVWIEGATMAIISDEGTIAYQGKLSVRGRGNTSWGFPKKPYAIRLDQKAALLGMPPNKHWCLLANWADRSLIRNAVAFELARQTELDWTPSGRHVELVVNGVHQGNYYLCEQIRVDENRVNVDNSNTSAVDRGYLMELDVNYDEACKFRSPLRNLPWQFKDPDEVTPEQQSFVEQYVAEMEDALYDSVRFSHRDFARYMDLESFADYWLVYEIAQLWEPNHPKSVFMHKDAGGKMKAGPVWDFDMGCFKPRPYYFWVDNTAVYYDRLFDDAAFCQLVAERLNRFLPRFLSVESYIDSLSAMLVRSEQINYPMWPITIDSSGDEKLSDYSEVIERIKRALHEKSLWMHESLPL